ncbi:hypothetical protein GCM10025868_01090 [Angustibacter aerolatus]|uniref:Uncharacterized protein n=1 Tax=Angustibacter aerolatus TaxID=1162965 RepID=A0ABQ6JCD6_9ACTN|nr:hypothetical protein GCM10025868_01090 [Angustibacter aerolatus]
MRSGTAAWSTAPGCCAGQVPAVSRARAATSSTLSRYPTPRPPGSRRIAVTVVVAVPDGSGASAAPTTARAPSRTDAASAPATVTR